MKQTSLWPGADGDDIHAGWAWLYEGPKITSTTKLRYPDHVADRLGSFGYQHTETAVEVLRLLDLFDQPRVRYDLRRGSDQGKRNRVVWGDRQTSDSATIER